MAVDVRHLRDDLLAVAMRDLGYSLAAIDEAIERAAIIEHDAGVDEHGANIRACRVVDAWPDEMRVHQVVPPAPAPAVAA